MPSIKRITHLIVRLDTGGAEKSLYRLIRATAGKLSHHVICFGPESTIGRDIAALGTPVTWLDYKKLGPLIFWRAWRLLRADPPDVVQGWMYFGNLIASVLSRGLSRALPRKVMLAWNIRQSPADFSLEKRRTRLSIWLARWLLPDLVIYNSFAGQQAHQRFGFNRKTNTVIVNGIDLQEFKPSSSERAKWRDQLGVGRATWVGLVCRYHPLKGVEEYLQAVGELADETTTDDIRFLLAGPGMDSDNSALMTLFKKYQIDPSTVDLLGPLDDTAGFLPALDLVVIASIREGTPNILLEAMACGVKTVATRVGDVERILRDPDRTVCPGDASDLAYKIRHALDEPVEVERQRILAEREFLSSNYQIEQCMAAYMNTYEELLA